VLYLPDDAVNTFTDGSSKPKPRRGGVGFRIVVTGKDGHQKVYKIQGADLDGAIDWAFSDLQLRPGHAYRVRFNENPSYPQIVERQDEVAVI